MKIILLRGHRAAVIDDRTDVVTVYPATDGSLVVNGVGHPIKNGGEAPKLEDTLRTRARFIRENGAEYKVLDPKVRKGLLTTCPDPFKTTIDLILQVDRLERELEEVRTELAAVKGRCEHNALEGILD